ncbi:hypothetical protein L13192_05218 [Pyrenophora tritici-repentis]|nr:hypothetical protein L13192_05218 [Pyrenophora tritici-repentis]
MIFIPIIPKLVLATLGYLFPGPIADQTTAISFLRLQSLSELKYRTIDDRIAARTKAKQTFLTTIQSRKTGDADKD